jgi:hypothetical protein
MPDSLGGSIKTYVGNFVPSPPPISENVLDFLHSSVPGGPPIREGAVADFVQRNHAVSTAVAALS